MKRGAAVAASIALLLGLGALGVACPARDLTIRVTDSGVATILTSCKGFQRACTAASACAEDQLICELVEGECVLRNRCHVGDKSHPTYTSTGKKEGKLLLVATDEASVADESPCFAFDPNPCVGSRRCLADVLNESFDELIKGGLTFDGYVAQEDALLTFAIFEADGAGEPSCDPDRLVACAGFAPPLGGGDFDITCASCQDSSHFALGRDNGVCPTSNDECFLQRCDRFLRAPKVPN